MRLQIHKNKLNKIGLSSLEPFGQNKDLTSLTNVTLSEQRRSYKFIQFNLVANSNI